MAIGLLEPLSPEQATAAIYIGYFDRAPDPNGVGFWLNEYVTATTVKGQTPGDALTNIANSFTPQQETSSIYPFLVSGIDANGDGILDVTQPNNSPEFRAALVDLIGDIYENLFGRRPEGAELNTPGEGVQYWVDEIFVRGTPLGKIILSIANGAVNANGTPNADGQLLLNKIEVATYFEQKTDEAGIGDDAAEVTPAFIQAARTVLDGVTANPSTVETAKQQVDAFVGPVEPETFLLTTGKDTADAAGSVRNDGTGDQFNFKFANSVEHVTASSTTLTAGDALSDPSTTDEDLIKVSADGATPLNLQTLVNLENIEINFNNYTGGALTFTNVSGAQDLDLNGTLGAAIPGLTGIANSGITKVDGSGLISTNFGIAVDFSTASGTAGRSLLGGQGNDTFNGSPVNDPTIFGDKGADNLDGFGGDDVLRGGGGNDFVRTGGGTRDKIVFEATAAENGVDDVPTGGAISFTLGAGQDQLDFSAFTKGGGAVGTSQTVREVPINSIAGDGVVATDQSVIVFDADLAIDTEAEIVAEIGMSPGNLIIGPDRDVVVMIQNAVGNTEAYYVETNAAGMASGDDVTLVATFLVATSANFTADNFII